MIGLTKIEKRFGELLVLKGITQEFREGGVTALIGPSGGGKSTLLRCINLLEIPTSGTVRIGDDAIEFRPGGKVPTVAVQRIRRQTGMIFQNFQLFPHRTAIENVMEAPVFVKGRGKSEARQQAMLLLERVGLAERAHHRPMQLSGGQQQRVAIARALVNQPRLLLADEPTGALDSRTALEILALFQDLNREGVTVVLVTHDAEVARHARRVVRFRDGHVIADTRQEPADARAALAAHDGAVPMPEAAE